MDVSNFKGLPVSNGIGIGQIYILEETNFKINKGKIQDNQVGYEIEKFELAVSETYTDIDNLDIGINKINTKDTKELLEVYKLILQDNYFIQEIKDTIKTLKCHAENAIDLCIKKYLQTFKKSQNERIKQKVYDIKDIRSRLLKNIMGFEADFKDINSENIVVVKELTPSLATLLANKRVKGVVSFEGGGYISHSAIILRSFGIPALDNVKYSEIKHFNNKFGIIDANKGVLTVGMDEKEIKKQLKSIDRKIERLTKNKSAVTKDGYKVNIFANINTIDEFSILKEKSIDGVGLVRTETLFMSDNTLPDERIQYIVYSELLRIMKDKPVVIRTADIGSDKMNCADNHDSSRIVLRGLGLSLIEKEQFIAQLRAIIRASAHGNVKIMFPMVRNHYEIKIAKNIINQISENLSKENGQELRKIEIGAVIENLEAVEDIEEILKQVDFISIGTNDLIQQITGINRKKIKTGGYEYLHPEFFRILQYCTSKAGKYEKKISICGEMAANPIGAIIFIGMEIFNLSMSYNNLNKIRQTISNLNFFKAKELVKKSLECNDEESVKQLFFNFFSKLRK